MKTAFILIVSLSLVAFNGDACFLCFKTIFPNLKAFICDANDEHVYRFTELKDRLKELLEDYEQKALITNASYNHYSGKLNEGKSANSDLAKIADQVLGILILKAKSESIKEINTYLKEYPNLDKKQAVNKLSKLLDNIRDIGVISREEHNKYENDFRGELQRDPIKLAKRMKKFILIDATIIYIRKFLREYPDLDQAVANQKLSKLMNDAIKTGLISQQEYNNIQAQSNGDLKVQATEVENFFEAKKAKQLGLAP